MNNYRIFGTFTTKTPLSHISESISTCSYLVQEPILQKNGTIEEVFCYNGNAFRGQLRDLAAQYLLDKLNMQVSLDAFHLLFSGGKIGGDQTIDIAQARSIRKTVPMIALFGGGVGNQILPGKMKVGSSYPICQEAIPCLADDKHVQAENLSYRVMTMEKSFTRMDDSKKPDSINSLSESAQRMIGGDKKKKEGEVNTQMRMTSELIISGVELAHEIDLVGVSDVELGALVSALHKFAEAPYIGGQSNRGHGRVAYTSTIVNSSTGEVHDLIKITGAGLPKLSRTAQLAKDAYDMLLKEQHDAWLEKSESEIRGLLGSK